MGKGSSSVFLEANRFSAPGREPSPEEEGLDIEVCALHHPSRQRHAVQKVHVISFCTAAVEEGPV